MTRVYGVPSWVQKKFTKSSQQASTICCHDHSIIFWAFFFLVWYLWIRSLGFKLYVVIYQGKADRMIKPLLHDQKSRRINFVLSIFKIWASIWAHYILICVCNLTRKDSMGNVVADLWLNFVLFFAPLLEIAAEPVKGERLKKKSLVDYHYGQIRFNDNKNYDSFHERSSQWWIRRKWATIFFQII